MWYIGIDNGVTGTIGYVNDDGSEYGIIHIPIKKCLDYKKSKISYVNRVDVIKLKEFFNSLNGFKKVLIEIPLVNPKMFSATISAVRCLEATLIVLEELNISYDFINAKLWQKYFNISKDTKKMSYDIANRMFPLCKDFNHADRDGLLIAEYMRVNY